VAKELAEDVARVTTLTAELVEICMTVATRQWVGGGVGGVEDE